jgi:hypothetical protein
VELEPGDALYLPRGYVHAALTTDVDSVHLTVGVLSTTWYDVLTDVVGLAAAAEEFREALPMQPTLRAGELLPDFLRRAATWLEQLPVADVERAVAPRLARSVPAEPVRLLATAAALRDLHAASTLRPRSGLAFDLRVAGGQVVLSVPGRSISLPAFTEPALRRLLQAPSTPAELPGLDVESALVLARRMLREGVVLPG